MYCLWLNGKKVYDLQQLKASYDAEAVALYCLGGGLSRWLRDCGESEAAEKVEQIDLSQSIPAQLAAIFGVDPPKTEEQPYRPAKASAAPISAPNGSFALPSSLTPDAPLSPSSFGSSFDTSSFNTSSFTFSNMTTSFLTTSFFTTSFGYEHEYEYESGSFTASSFSLYLSSFFTETAFLTGSFSLGSFTLGSFSTEYASFPISGSFSPILSSFSPKSAEAASTTPAPAPEKEPSLTPQQKFELNLSSNPLNRYGYGIHLI